MVVLGRMKEKSDPPKLPVINVNEIYVVNHVIVL